MKIATLFAAALFCPILPAFADDAGADAPIPPPAPPQLPDTSGAPQPPPEIIPANNFSLSH